jgi:hypothetical protein
VTTLILRCGRRIALAIRSHPCPPTPPNIRRTSTIILKTAFFLPRVLAAVPGVEVVAAVPGVVVVAAATVVGRTPGVPTTIAASASAICRQGFPKASVFLISLSQDAISRECVCGEAGRQFPSQSAALGNKATDRGLACQSRNRRGIKAVEPEGAGIKTDSAQREKRDKSQAKCDKG